VKIFILIIFLSAKCTLFFQLFFNLLSVKYKIVRSKKSEIKYYFICDKVWKGQVILRYISTKFRKFSLRRDRF